jgi:hypothetical protein
MRLILAFVSLAALLVASPSYAQARGKTTGPEGSEIGKGGYVPAAGEPGMFSLQVDFGGAFPNEGSFSPPLFFGGTASFWGSEWYRIDLSGAFIPADDDVNVFEALVGPSVRFPIWPIGLSLGVQAGAYVPRESGDVDLPEGAGDTRFVVSPRAGLDFLVEEQRLQLGLYANYDLTIGDVDLSIVRTYLSLGYRF